MISTDKIKVIITFCPMVQSQIIDKKRFCRLKQHNNLMLVFSITTRFLFLFKNLPGKLHLQVKLPG